MIDWLESPPSSVQSSAYLRRREFVEKLKTRPGVWAQYRPGHPHPCNTGHQMARDYPGTETTVRTRDDGRFDVYARWTGP